MRKQISAVVTAVLFAVALIPAPTAYAMPDQVIHHTVRYACIAGHSYGMLVGEWTLSCTGWSGWGWEPGHNCTYTETEYGPECGGGPIDPPLDP
jgi:hypothetical protein